MWDDDTDDDNDSIIVHSCNLIARAATFVENKNPYDPVVPEDMGGLHEDKNVVLSPKFILGLVQIIFAPPIECCTVHSGTCWRKELNKRA